jgi:hypothetical protein
MFRMACALQGWTIVLTAFCMYMSSALSVISSPILFFIVEIGVGIVAYPHALVNTGWSLYVVGNVAAPPPPAISIVVFAAVPIDI